MLVLQAVNFKRAEAAASDHTLDLFVGVLRNERHWLAYPRMKPIKRAILPSSGVLARWRRRHTLWPRQRRAAASKNAGIALLPRGGRGKPAGDSLMRQDEKSDFPSPSAEGPTAKSERLRETLITTLTGFILTGVIGTMVATWFQQRGWAWQNAVAQVEKDTTSALASLQSVSGLLDK